MRHGLLTLSLLATLKQQPRIPFFLLPGHGLEMACINQGRHANDAKYLGPWSSSPTGRLLAMIAVGKHQSGGYIDPPRLGYQDSLYAV